LTEFFKFFYGSGTVLLSAFVVARGCALGEGLGLRRVRFVGVGLGILMSAVANEVLLG